MAELDHTGTMQIPLVLLGRLLQLPMETTILEVKTEASREGNFTLVVKHPDLPGVAAGTPPPEVAPVWERDADGVVVWHVVE